MRIIPVLSWLLVSFLFWVTVSFAIESEADKLLDLLTEKGVVSKEEAAGFRADLAVKRQEEKEGQKEFIVIAGKPIKISGYTQLRYREDRSSHETFDIRRARLDIKGDVTERFDYRSQIEFGGTSGVFLLDATIGYKVNPYIKLTAGQFKIPFSQENLISSPKLETINRSQVVEALVARGKDVIGNHNGRDIGVQVNGSILPQADYYLIDYAVGVFNGSGINKVDLNGHKDLVGRLIFRTLKDFIIGGSYYEGDYISSNGSPSDRDRIGAEFAYAHDPISLKGEYIKGNDGITNKDGWYLQAGYFVIPKKLQGIFKYDFYDPNGGVRNDETKVYTLGSNWYFNKWAFLQVNYEIKDDRAKKEISNNALTGQLTLQF